MPAMPDHPMPRRCALLMLPLALAAVGLSGCGTPADAPAMRLSLAESLQLRSWVPPGLRAQVQLMPVSGGQPTGRFWGAKISNASLQEALEESLRDTGLYAPRPADARYELRVTLMLLDQPMVAVLDAKVAVTLSYTLMESRTGRTIYERKLRTQHTAEFGSAILDPNERMRMASEGAIRSNVNTLLRELLELKWPE
ncbi:hypothetical protein C1O66_13640 [Paucibacter aquatile]|uniref:ABC-type transport auxiliary lipoprotein component domain-containing protein n=1 Tax=Kinneretia aquatilis TaxID=2070761 RepID=A0A2N8KYC6_9BURK|nr:hypothetical protein [Paucibacter aquatile]PND38460.1 hypothetical protein C1O66_13640 [Paucibacter aquatile]